MRRVTFTVLLLWALCFVIFPLQANSSTVSTLINAKWKQTPLYLEIAEYLDENNFWNFAKSLNELGKPLAEYGTESQQYLAAINIAKLYIGSSQLPLLKLTVAMHSLTPRIQAHLQSANATIKEETCASSSTFAVIESEIACTLNELKAKIKRHSIKSSKDYSAVEVYNFDHIYPGSENNLLTVLLYGDIGKQEFLDFHNFLSTEITTGSSNVRYIFRHYLRDISPHAVRLSAYGVDLHLKSTEYKSQDEAPKKETDGNIAEDYLSDEDEVNGLDFKVLKARFPHAAQSLEQLKKSLIHTDNSVPQLRATEFQDLGLKAAATIAEIQADESLQILQCLSQNFPMLSKGLLSKKVAENLRKEIEHNTQVFRRSLNIMPPDGSLFINGLYFDADSMELENLLEIIRTDMQVLDTFNNNNIRGSLASALLTIDLSKTKDREFAIDIRDSAIFWVNDIETDPQYRRWPGSITDLLRPTFPGMLRNIRKNLFNLVIVLDPLDPKSRSLLKLANSFVTHLAPVRLGLVFDTRKATPMNATDYRAAFCAFNYITQKHDGRAALSFLSELMSASAKSNSPTRSKDIEQFLQKIYASISATDIFGEDSEYDYGRELALEFVNRLGLSGSPQALLNGVPMQQTVLESDSEFEEAIFTEIMQQTAFFQKAVYRGDLTDSESIIDYLMNQPHVMPRLNQRILAGDKARFLDVSGTPHNDLSNVRKLAGLSNSDMTATLASNLKYFKRKSSKKMKNNELQFLTLWIFADLSTLEGRELLKNALLHLKSSADARIAFIPNCEGAAATKNILNKLIWAYSQSEIGFKDIDMVLKWLENPPETKDVPEVVKENLGSADLHLKMLRVYTQRVLNLRNSARAVVANAKIYGPLDDEEQFGTDDFHLIEHLSSMQYGDKILKVFQQNNKETQTQFDSDILLKVYASLLTRATKPRFKIPVDVKQDFSVIKLNLKDEAAPHFDVVAIIDPASKAAQKLSPILILLRNIINCQMRVFMTPLSKHSDMPVKNFYRYVIEPEVQFDTHGKLTEAKLIAKFTQLPTNALLTQNLQVPDNWLVESVQSVYDLDNIKLSEIGGPVYSEFELEFLLLEGHCFDSTTGAPPRGLQVTLGRNGQQALVDTIVMANLGYFQLKANPGAWELRLREGKSADIYDITSVEGPNTLHDGQMTKIVISSLRSHVIKLRVSKKADKQDEDLLADTEDNGANSGIWNSIANSFTGGGSTSVTAEADNTINIFSVASGHLYERLLRIMMVSLLKHTKSPVKFWFLKNYLSPQFTDFLPDMAREYKFQFELVQYKWPRWLHQQTEKQRTIWGYKILFLDVLFPLNVRKIIFVDADAIVRADINQLYEMDLGNAPYAYTPFCDSRKEMDGFRFWKQGYWRSHLAGRRYHISALYVVDLKRFRKIAAGDRLRGQYQALSQDPNSLSNLDQDLPNNMIHQVAIKSLPEEWLWCETWCNDSSFKTAKVIDLCNNPQTKEAKLTAAQRLIPEWKTYDEEIKQLMERIQNGENNIEHDVKDDESLNLKKSQENEKHIEL